MRTDDTIVAISTPPGRGGIGVVRLSGTAARAIADAFLRFPRQSQWQSWQARLAVLPDEAGERVDDVIVTWFGAPRSYTAEDVVEIACHGAPVVLQHCVVQACQAGARVAEPGEFTLRAFLNGRLDLPKSEAVRDLIQATTLYQAKVAAQQVHGSVSRRIGPLKERLVTLIALLEAGIDFAEDDVPVASDEEILEQLNPIRSEVESLVSSFAYGRLVHEGFTLAIAGLPNAGKSSLFNRLLGQERSIVTGSPGTTRDSISETAEIEGIPVRFVDTAGIRASADEIELLGIERSYQAIADADLTLVVVDHSVPWSEEAETLVKRAGEQGLSLTVLNKADLPQSGSFRQTGIEVSCRTGAGIPELRKAVLRAISPGGGIEIQQGFLTSMRHAQLLEESRSALERASKAVAERIPHEMLLLDLYEALRPIDAITGVTTADDILNRIFATFCIGK